MSKVSLINDAASGGDEPIGAINVTSLVDVMLCLLIMFMVSAPLAKPSMESEVDLPPVRGEVLTEEEMLYGVITVDKTGQSFLGALPLSKDPEKMKQEVAANAKFKEDGVVFIQADQAVEHGRIIDLLLALREAEVNEVGFVTDPNPRRVKEARGQ